MSDSDRTKAEELQRIQRLLASATVIASACELDLLVFLTRHPLTLLTNEQLAAFVGYDTKRIAKSVEAFIEAGLLERTQNTTHAARMYVLLLDGPRTGEIQALVDLASTRQGRGAVLQVLAAGRRNARLEQPRSKRFHAIA